jgi:uncharacterized protein (TIGR03000 family)
LLALFLVLGLTGVATTQEKKAGGDGEKKKTTIKFIFQEPTYKDPELTIEGMKTKATGATREFVTPDLEVGKTYEYTIVAVIDPNNYTTITRTKTITFKAGEEITVDLRQKDEKDRVKIRWVPTPKDIAVQMGKLAKIGKDDVVYDLGCGDGIMIVTAVKELGAKKGVGIDLDPKRVEEANAKAKAEGIDKKIEIRKGDILDVKDISDANVVMLYLADEMNLRLRPMLWKSLKPGARIVSHRFIMGDWKPETTKRVKGEDGDDYVLHVWTITGKEKDGKYDKGNVPSE